MSEKGFSKQVEELKTSLTEKEIEQAIAILKAQKLYLYTRDSKDRQRVFNDIERTNIFRVEKQDGSCCDLCFIMATLPEPFVGRHLLNPDHDILVQKAFYNIQIYDHNDKLPVSFRGADDIKDITIHPAILFTQNRGSLRYRDHFFLYGEEYIVYDQSHAVRVKPLEQKAK